MQQLSDHLCWTEDTCSVYAVTVGNACLLIDCGEGLAPGSKVISALPAIDKVLLTHFHRDQCAAATKWQRSGISVVVPFTERRFFEEADLQRAAYDVYNSYESYYPAFGPPEDIRSGEYAFDYEHIHWREIEFTVLPLPGHTFGSCGYLFEIDGLLVLACGDLLSAPGKLREYYWSQWTYMDFTGHANHLESLRAIETLELDLILPGHGRPFAPSCRDIAALRESLEEIYELFHAKPYEYFCPQFRQVSPHVIEVENSGAKTYLVRDDDGHAVCIDCGYAATAPINANPHRFIDGLTPYLEHGAAIRNVEWFLCSHYHDDHLAGYPALRNRYETRFAASPELKDILEYPERYEMPCLMPRGFPIDRVIQRGEAFEWRGIRFFVEQQPGQTLLHQLIWFEVDSKTFLVAGDNVSGLSFDENRDYIYSFIPKNRTPVSRYLDIPGRILELAPDVVLFGHGPAAAFDRDRMERWRSWMEQWVQAFDRVIDQPTPDMGMDPRWVEFYPYKVRVQPGETIHFGVTVTNHERELRHCRLRFRSVDGTRLVPTECCLTIDSGSTSTCEVEATFPETFRTHSLPIFADVTWNGKHLGEIAEAVAYW